MESHAKFAGHPIHQMLVAFPIGAFGMAVSSDVLRAGRRQPQYEYTAARAIDFGLISAAIAAPFGLVDWFAIPPGTRAKRVGLWHALGNAALLGLFASSRWLRGRRDLKRAEWVAGAGMLLGGMTAWLGGELINRHGVGVSEALGLDASSSLRRSPGARVP
jgi:uncharacterized membrane protein